MMNHDLVNRVADAVRAFNVQVEQAKRKGLPFVVEVTAADHSASDGMHLYVLRTMPVSWSLAPNVREDHCNAQIALLRAAEEVNRAADEAGRQNVRIRLKVQGGGCAPGQQQLELVAPALL